MLVRASTYRNLQAQYVALRMDRDALLSRWNSLVREINEKGGRSFLDGPAPMDLSRQDIDRLIALCHPDKHDGKQIAVEMTQKLLSIRDKSST